MRTTVPSLALAWLASACGLGGSVAPDADAASSVSDATAERVSTLASCVMDVRAQPYAVGMRSAGAASGPSVEVLSVDPATPPPLRANYQWTVLLRSASGAPMPDATFAVQPWMPDHGHGASVVPTVEALGEGRYAVHNVDLFMEGVWTVTFRVQTPGADGGVASIPAVFTVCVGGT